MNYNELKSKHTKVMNEFPMFFAFSNEQLAEGMTKLGLNKEDTDKIYSTGGGGYMKKTDSSAFKKMIEDFGKDMDEAMKDDDFMTHAIRYELGNHEYCITWDDSDALSALGLDREKEQVKRCLLEAKEQYALDSD